jgi:hypothetical protein
VLRPDRVLLLVIYNDSVSSSVFLIWVMPTHTIKPPYFGSLGTRVGAPAFCGLLTMVELWHASASLNHNGG